MPGMKDGDFTRPVWNGPDPQPPPKEEMARHIDIRKQRKAGKSMRDIFFEYVKNRKTDVPKVKKGGQNG